MSWEEPRVRLSPAVTWQIKHLTVSWSHYPTTGSTFVNTLRDYRTSEWSREHLQHKTRGWCLQENKAHIKRKRFFLLVSLWAAYWLHSLMDENHLYVWESMCLFITLGNIIWKSDGSKFCPVWVNKALVHHSAVTINYIGNTTVEYVQTLCTSADLP